MSASDLPSSSSVRSVSASMPSRPVTTSDASPKMWPNTPPPRWPWPPWPTRSPWSGRLSLSWATTASACSAVIVPSSTSGCSASRSRVPESGDAVDSSVVVSSGVVSAGVESSGSCLRVCCTTALGDAALDKPGTPNANPAAAPPRSPAVRPMVTPRARYDFAGASFGSIAACISLSLSIVVWPFGTSGGGRRASAPPDDHPTRPRQEAGMNAG